MGLCNWMWGLWKIGTSERFLKTHRGFFWTKISVPNSECEEAVVLGQCLWCTVACLQPEPWTHSTRVLHCTHRQAAHHHWGRPEMAWLWFQTLHAKNCSALTVCTEFSALTETQWVNDEKQRLLMVSHSLASEVLNYFVFALLRILFRVILEIVWAVVICMSREIITT